MNFQRRSGCKGASEGDPDARQKELPRGTIKSVSAVSRNIGSGGGWWYCDGARISGRDKGTQTTGATGGKKN